MTAFWFFLQKMKADLNMKKSLLNTLENELQRTLQIHSQSCQSYTLYDMDIGKYCDKVTQLIDRWQRADKQIDNRFVHVFRVFSLLLLLPRSS